MAAGMFKLSLTATAATALLLVPALAAAQPAVTAPGAAPLPAAEAPAPADPYSPATALALSLGATAAGYMTIALVHEVDDNDTAIALGWAAAAGIGLGPTVGHWYQGDVVTRGLGLRAAGTVAFIYGLSEADLFCDDCSDNDFAGAMMVGGLLAFGAGTIDDIVMAPIKARRKNEKHRASAFQLSVAPRITGKDAGIVAIGRF